MFKKVFIDLCNDRNESPSAVCKKIGLSNAAFSCWDDNSVPRRATLQKLANYFGVTVDYLLGNDDTHARVNTNEKKPADVGELSKAERALIKLFRSVDEDNQEFLVQTIQAVLSAKGLL